jgi:NAD(P)H-hydrate epimerase
MLASMAAARVGAGYVTLAAPEPIVPILQGRLLSIPVRALPARGGVLDVHAAANVMEIAQKARAIVIGPGMGRTRGVTATVSALLARYEGPLLVDADGLHVLSSLSEEAIARAERHAPLVVTPHFGELLKLAEGAGINVSELPRHATDEAIPVMKHAKLAVQVARAYGATVVAKGAVPIVTNGATTVFSADGSASLATAGTGDVLSGIIGGLLAQGLDAVQASALGLHYGGLSARAAADVRGPGGVIAEDIIEHLGDAILRTLGR